MATTTNFGWETPDDTDLVKDGAAAIRTALGGVDTSFVDLKGGTTGQILSKASNTDLDYTWITNDVGDITAVTAGTGISGGGTSGAVTITNSMATAITTAGDLIKGTGSGTFDRLGIGSTGQVLTVSGGAPVWSTPASGGGWTSLASGSVAGASLDLTSISGSYKNLRLVIRNLRVDTATEPAMIVNSDGGSNYSILKLTGTGSTVTNTATNSATNVPFSHNNVKANSTMTVIYDFPDYANTTSNKIFTSNAYYVTSASSDNYQTIVQATWRNTNAITGLQLGAYGIADFNAGTYILYGGN